VSVLVSLPSSVVVGPSDSGVAPGVFVWVMAGHLLASFHLLANVTLEPWM
jgi:hypothetical protein